MAKNIKDILYPIVSIVLVVLLVYGVYLVADALGGAPAENGQPGKNETSTVAPGTGSAEEAEALFYAAMLKPLEYDSYAYAYEETASNGHINNVFLTASEEFSYAMREDAIFKRELFISGETMVLCMENVNRRLCIEVDQNSSFNLYTYTMSSLLFDKDRIKTNEKNNRLLIQYGGIVFKPEVVSREYRGKACRELAYTLDYSKLTVEQMRVIGMDPSSPEVLASKEYNYTICIDPATKEVLYRTLTYIHFGEPASTSSVTTVSEWGAHQPINLPDDLAEEEQLQEFYTALRKSQENYVKCMASSDFASCLRGEAILSRNEKLCSIIQDAPIQESCYINVALEKGEPLVCNFLPDEKKADCLIEFAWKYRDTAYCGQIADSAKQQECISAATSPTSPNGAAPGPKEPPASGEPEEESSAGTECRSDADCVTAGCSSHLCVPKSLSDIITTCEYLPEYECLALSSCGCNNGACGWEENQAYLNCLEEKANR